MLLPDILPTQENTENGILIVLAGEFAEHTPAVRRSFFGDRNLDLGQVLNRFAESFESMGVALARTPGSASRLERSIRVASWPEVTPVAAHGPQLIPKIANQAGELDALLKALRPKLVIFLSCYLWKAMNEAQAMFRDSAGQPLDAGRRITQERLAAYLQRWEKLTVLALAVPGKNTTERYFHSIASGVQLALRQARLLPQDALDPLLEQARNALVFDHEASIRNIRTQLHVDKKRAEELFDALEGLAYRTDATGRPLIAGSENC